MTSVPAGILVARACKAKNSSLDGEGARRVGGRWNQPGNRSCVQGGSCGVASTPLPSGWTGKLWAVHQGVEAAARWQPDFYLLTDADIVHAPDNVACLLAHAQAGNYDLVSLMVRLHCRSLAEKFLIPAFVFFFFLLYPPRWVSDSRRRTAAAAGGCMLIRRAALERIGGIAAIKRELIDDCALARKVKRKGGRIWLGVSASTRSIREYKTFAEIGRMISRTAFTQLRHSPWLLAATILGMLLIYAVPPVLAIRGNVFGIAAWVLMTGIFVPVVWFYRLSPLWRCCCPPLPCSISAQPFTLPFSTGAGAVANGRVAYKTRYDR